MYFFTSEKVQTQLSTLSTLTQESFSGIRILKSFVNETTNFNLFKSETNEYLKRNVSLAKTNAAFFPFMLLLIGLSTLLTIYVGAPTYMVSKVLKPINKSIKGKKAALVLAKDTLRLRYSLVSDLKRLKLVVSLTKDFKILIPEKDS